MTDYDRRSIRGAEGLAAKYAADWLGDILGSGRSLFSWASAQPGAQLLHGRGTVYAVESPFPGPDREPVLVVRHYHRGGLITSHLGDRYLRLGQPRPEREALVSAEARRRGIPTPAVIAAAWYRSGAFYRGDLITEMVPGSRSLAELLFSAERSPDSTNALAQSGSLIRSLEENGILHADLNAMNVLINRQAGELSAHVIDLDRARLVPSGRGHSMRERLERSLRKLGDASARPLSPDDWSVLRAGWRNEA